MKTAGDFCKTGFPVDIMSQSLDELVDFFDGLGLPKYRAQQVFTWLHKKNVTSFSDMTNVPKNIQSLLAKTSTINSAECVKRLVSKSDGTEKLLYKLHDGTLLESVVMDYSFGKSICISTQAGCKMGCVFCASGENGFERNLSAGEMLSQVYHANADLASRTSPYVLPGLCQMKKGKNCLNRIVLMGCGEPLDNFDNVVKFLHLASQSKGLNMGARHITLSTCGVVPKIYELAEIGLQINLAVSLHAPTDDIRKELMPIAATYSLDELIDACKHYAFATKRRITYEYSLIDGINDYADCAKKLAKLIAGSLCHVNLIPVNPCIGGFMPSSKNKAMIFAKTLQNHGIETTIRRSTGGDINAACGQLRRLSTLHI